ncbi:cytochrome P450 3A31-like [Asterias rubens]|uniref:cytochrome P450 3A31-like n=1 Tax=Asterias rubens TaxID=7604 RepID=UPI001455D20A|nr:cytochrome P450 3A31-like [Asterias rubens]
MLGVVLTLFGILAAWLAWSTYSRRTYYAKLGLKGPPPLPIFGNMFHFRDGVHIAIQKWTKEYGRVFGIFRGSKKAIITSDLEFVKEVMVKKFSNFTDREQFPLRPKVMNEDLLGLQGARWKHMREAVALAFSKSKVQQMVSMVNDCTDATLKDIESENETKNDETKKVSLDINSYMARFGMDVSSLCFFASKLGSQEERSILMHHSREMWKHFKTAYPPWIITMLFPWLESVFLYFGCAVHPHESINFFGDLVNGIMDVRKIEKNSTKYKDFLQLMVNSHKDPEAENKSNGHLIQRASLTKTEIFSMCMSFFTGNLETSPATLSYCFYLLALHPEIQERVIQEIDEVMNSSDITLEKTSQLVYTDMVIRETLRLYPTVASLNRICKEDCVIQGVTVPKGVTVEIAVHAIQNDPEYWPDPEKFDPERFAPEKRDQIHPSAWLAFGQGPRMCIGYRFAMMEIFVVLTRVFQIYRVEVSGQTEIPPKRGTRGLLTPENGINIRLVPRKDVTVN